jgi:hypothetical protein
MVRHDGIAGSRAIREAAVWRRSCSRQRPPSAAPARVNIALAAW